MQPLSLSLYSIYLCLFLPPQDSSNSHLELSFILLIGVIAGRDLTVYAPDNLRNIEESSKMSCNGCRVLRKGCNENCILRQSLQGFESPQAQANATVFVAKFFGRAGLMSFLSAVPELQRPALFQSLLFEACGRTVNPVNGAVGLLWTGNWRVCQSAVETVLRGGALRAIPEFSGVSPAEDLENASDTYNVDFFGSRDLNSARKVKHILGSTTKPQPTADLDLCLAHTFPARMTAGERANRRADKRRAETPSLNSEESDTTTLESGSAYNHRTSHGRNEAKLLRLFF